MTRHRDSHVATKPRPLLAAADINITPMIDILLVLLVIFMAALPLSQRGLDTQIPPPASGPLAPPPSGQIVLEMTAARELSVNQTPVQIAGLEPYLRDVFRERTDKTLYIMGDGRLPYGEIVGVIDAAKGEGVARVGIVTESMRRR